MPKRQSKHTTKTKNGVVGENGLRSVFLENLGDLRSLGRIPLHHSSVWVLSGFWYIRVCMVDSWRALGAVGEARGRSVNEKGFRALVAGE